MFYGEQICSAMVDDDGLRLKKSSLSLQKQTERYPGKKLETGPGICADLTAKKEDYKPICRCKY